MYSWIQCRKTARWYSSHRPMNSSRKFLGVAEAAAAAANRRCGPAMTSVHARLTINSGTPDVVLSIADDPAPSS